MARRAASLQMNTASIGAAVPQRPDDDPGRQFVAALARGLQVLKAFGSADISLSNQEIAQKTSLPKPTVSRVTYTLMRLGYLAYSERSGRYRLGTAALALGCATASGSTIQRVVRPLMENVAIEMNACAALGFRDGLDVVYLEYCRGRNVLDLALDRGSRVPLTSTAAGRAIIAAMLPAERELVVQRLIAAGGERGEALAAIDRAIEDYRRLGFTISASEWHPEVNSVAVPIMTGASLAPLALSLGGPAYRITRDHLVQQIAPRLQSLAQSIESQLRFA